MIRIRKRIGLTKIRAHHALPGTVLAPYSSFHPYSDLGGRHYYCPPSQTVKKAQRRQVTWPGLLG